MKGNKLFSHCLKFSTLCTILTIGFCYLWGEAPSAFQTVLFLTLWFNAFANVYHT